MCQAKVLRPVVSVKHFVTPFPVPLLVTDAWAMMKQAMAGSLLKVCRENIFRVQYDPNIKYLLGLSFASLMSHLISG